jgi:hypothetical protein
MVIFAGAGAPFIAQPDEQAHAKADRHAHGHDKPSPKIQVGIGHKAGGRMPREGEKGK